MNHFKILIITTIFLLSIQFGFSFDFQKECEEVTFITTAYYSPKSWQAFYYKDTFEQEKVLNGEWYYWASWKWVFNGMLAAPSSYDFGGLIYFPSLWWVWEIADRWWAIVNAWERWHEYDRIDIWMWTWELWLVKALTRWKQTIKWYYCDSETVKSKWIKANIGFNLESIPLMKYFFDASLFIQELWYWRTDIWVYKLQEYLSKLGYMTKITWYFWWETKTALCKYQIKRWLSTQKYCWTFGSQTRYYMKNELKSKWLLPDFTETATIDDLIYYSKNYTFKKDEVSSVKVPENNVSDSSVSTLPQNDNKPKITNYFTEPYNNWTTNSKIWDLQDLLRYLWFYEWELTNTYDKKTVNAVHNFQVAAWILKASDTKNPARWRLGPSTRNALNERRSKFQEFKNNEKWRINN